MNGKEKALAKMGGGGEIVRRRSRTEKSLIVAGE